MSEGMTPERLAEIEAREKAATEGPWAYGGQEGFQSIDYPQTPPFETRRIECGGDTLANVSQGGTLLPSDEANALFIAHARQDIPDLVAEVKRQEQELDIAAKKLAWCEGEVKRLQALREEVGK